MASVNKVTLIGNLGRDPEVRYQPSGDAVANVALATSRSWKDKQSGEKREETEWHRVTFFGRLAEVVGEYAKKGSSIYVEGRLKTDKWTDKDGTDRYTTSIIADDLKLLGGRDGSGAASSDKPSSGGQRPASSKSAASAAPAAAAAKPARDLTDLDDDIPF